MKKSIKIYYSVPLVLAVVLGAIFFTRAYAFRNVKRVDKIIVKGLHYLSKHEIIDGVSATADQGGIVIDIDSLRDNLEENLMIRKYSISETGNSIIVVIIEKEPICMLGVRHQKVTALFELDREYKILSRNRIHAVNRPLIIVPKSDVAGGKLSERLREFIGLLQILRERKITIVDEISEVDLRELNRITLFLRKRRTEFLLKPDQESFYQLNYFVAYLDQKRFYPKKFHIINDRSAVIW